MTDSLLLTDIEVDPGINPRANGTDPETVEDYAAALKDGHAFPPVVVYRDAGGTVRLSEGFHRYAAHATAGCKAIACEVREGDRLAALLNALASNRDHGLKRSNADKRKAIELAFAACPDWSDRRIADHCGVSKTFVNECRREFQVATVATCPAEQVSESGTCPKRIGKDGKTYPAKTEKKQPEPVKQVTDAADGNRDERTPEPPSSGGGSEAGEGAGESGTEPAPEPVHPADEFVAGVEALCRDMDQIAARVRGLKVSPYSYAVHWQSAADQVAAARSALWNGRPLYNCPYCEANGEVGPDCRACRGTGRVYKGTYDRGVQAVGGATA